MSGESGSFGYGQLTPYDWGNDTNAFAFMVRQIVGRLATVKVVKVVAVHAGAGTPPAAGMVDVLPLVKQMDGAGFTIPNATVFGLQYFRLQAGKWAIIADPAVGDIGLIVCADRDSTAVTSSGEQVTPGSRRRYSISDGIYLGGIMNAAPEAYFQLNADGSLQVSDKSGNVLKMDSNGFELTGNMKVTGNIAATGTIIAGQGGADQVGLQTHTHPTNGSPPTPGT